MLSLQIIINGLKHGKPPVWPLKVQRTASQNAEPTFDHQSDFLIMSLHPLIFATQSVTSHEYISNEGGLTILRAEKFRIGSSAASETELSMMNTRMRLVNM